MAGHPKKQALIHALTSRALEEEDETPLEYVVGWLQGGKTMVELAAEISKDTKMDHTDRYITRYLSRAYPDTFASEAAAARKLGAFAMVDEARSIIDNAPTYDKTVLAKEIARASIRQWTAERFNRAELGAPKEQMQVNVSIASLHMDALRQRNTARVAASREWDSEGDVRPSALASHTVGHDTMADVPADVAYEVMDEV